MADQPPPHAGATASSSEPSNDTKPAVLIIGGLGYIGRFLALHLHKNNLACSIRLVDKVLPQLARLAPEFSDACSPSNFLQADASREQSLAKIFTPPASCPRKEYTYVFNCGGETRYSQEDAVYKARSVELSVNLARECARRKTPALVEFSTGQIYKRPNSSTVKSGGCKEDATTKPWTKLAKYKLFAEEELEKLRKTEQLRYVVLRLGHVYGPYDMGYLARGLCLAKVYERKREEMKWLWTKDLRVNTVHVEDVCAAAFHAATWCASTAADQEPAGLDKRTFNIVDQGDTSQGTLATIFSQIFDLKTGFQGSLISSFARFNMESVVDDVNEEILGPWADLLKENGITDSGPLSPFMEKELLRDCDLCLDASRARKVLGWKVEDGREALTVEGVRSVLDSYRRMGWWP
ncbi:MAG: hypothetical protein L6R38_002681 [Xanthoria sp. 2 TBL-2021]|nr:MAG: hypothetical protein L6R38_002681 [Xanthoria sp. 2 TBL-2021]